MTVLEKITNFVESGNSRAIDCYNVLTNQKIDIYNILGTKVTSAESISDVAIPRIGLTDNDVTYCINELKNAGFSVDSPKSVLSMNYPENNHGVFQCEYAKADTVVIPNPYFDKKISIGKSTNANGEEIEGCRYIVRDFNYNEGDAIDLSSYKLDGANTVVTSNIVMNGLNTKVIDVNSVGIENLVCLHGFSDELPATAILYNSIHNQPQLVEPALLDASAHNDAIPHADL